MSERQLRVAIIAGGTLLALLIVTVLWAVLLATLTIPTAPVTNLQLPTL